MAETNAIDLLGHELEVLEHACHFHSMGRTEGDLIAQICWDADRLDLGRVGVEPEPERLCTDAAKDPDIFDWASDRGRRHAISDIVFKEWGITWVANIELE